MFKSLFRVESPPPWSLTGAMFTFFGLFLTMILGAGMAQTFIGDDPITPVVGWTTGAALAIIFVLVTRRRSLEEVEALRLDPNPEIRLPIIALFCVGMAIAFDVVGLGITGDFWPTPELFGFFAFGEDNAVAAVELSLIAWLIAFVFMVFMQPVAEELVLRGVLFPAMRSAVGPGAGYAMVVVFHTLFHVLAYLALQPDDFTVAYYGVIVPLLDAVVITGVRAHTGSTRAAIVAHAAFGAFAVLKAFTLTG